MAADTVGLLDALKLDSAHIVGASLAGWSPRRSPLSTQIGSARLTSMFSTTGDRAVGQADFAALGSVGAPPQDRRGYIDWQVRAMRAVGSPGFAFDEPTVADRAARYYDRDYDPLGMLRQAVAVVTCGDRTARLRKLRLPTLVIHGTADKMCDISGGRATAAAIPGAKLRGL